MLVMCVCVYGLDYSMHRVRMEGVEHGSGWLSMSAPWRAISMYYVRTRVYSSEYDLVHVRIIYGMSLLYIV